MIHEHFYKENKQKHQIFFFCLIDSNPFHRQNLTLYLYFSIKDILVFPSWSLQHSGQLKAPVKAAGPAVLLCGDEGESETALTDSPSVVFYCADRGQTKNRSVSDAVALTSPERMNESWEDFAQKLDFSGLYMMCADQLWIMHCGYWLENKCVLSNK